MLKRHLVKLTLVWNFNYKTLNILNVSIGQVAVQEFIHLQDILIVEGHRYYNKSLV